MIMQRDRAEDHERAHRHLRNAANERGQRSANCLFCGQQFEPECGFWGCEKPKGHDGMHRRTAQVIPEQVIPEYDFRMESDAGPMTTVFRLVPLTDNAKGWIADNVSRTEGYQPEWPTLFVEHGNIDALLEGIGEAGLIVDVVERALVVASTPGCARCQHCNEPIEGAGTCPQCGLQVAP